MNTVKSTVQPLLKRIDMNQNSSSAHEPAAALLTRIQAGDREAFKEVARAYQSKVYALAYSFFRNHEDAMDIVQETFLRLYQKADMYKQGKSFKNWLLQIAKNLCIDTYRKQHRKDMDPPIPRHIEDLNLADENLQNSQLSSDLKTILSQCLNKLSDKQRMIFVMKHVNQLKYNEIAQILNLAVGTVKSLNFKAVQNLRALMSPYMGEQS